MKAILPILFGASAAMLAPLGPLLTPEAALAASAAPQSLVANSIVNCAAPASPNDLLVCTDAELRQRDRVLAGLVAATPDADLGALDIARELCQSAACLRASYDDLIRDYGGAGASS